MVDFVDFRTTRCWRNVASVLVFGGAIPVAVAAQEAAPLPDDDAAIVVTAQRVKGSVDTDVPADLVLDPIAIASYGASSAADLLSALAPQTRSGRGRGDGTPLVLVNGRRVSGFSEIRDLPSEAIQRVETFPEEVALKYGYSPDQRVINFILKDKFRAISGEAEYLTPSHRGRGEAQLQSSFLNIGKTGRINLSAQYNNDTALLESERQIIQSSGETGVFRTLLPSNQAIGLNGTLNRLIAPRTGITINLRYDQARTRALLGLDSLSIPIARDVRTEGLQAGVTVDGNVGRWQWVLTGNHDVSRIRTLTDRGVAATDRDQARSTTQTSNATLSVSGSPITLPAGPVSLSMSAGFENRNFASDRRSAFGANAARLRRGVDNVFASLDLPLASRKTGVGAAIGDLSINGNFRYRQLTDFGSLISFGYGLNWSPLKGLSILSGITAVQEAPSPLQLGNPEIVTPNVTTYDLVRGKSAIITVINGGNAGLRAEERRDVKIGISYTPPPLEALTLSANYFRNRSRNPVANFPLLTPSIEAAFPGRIVRGTAGELISIDQRPINFLASRSEQLRLGASFSREFGKPAERRGEGTRPDIRTAVGGPPRGGGGGGGFGRFGGNGQGGRWQVSLFDTIKFRDEIALAAGIPILNLRDGGATGTSGGTAQHVVDLEGGWFNKGIGLRATATYQSATTVSGGALASDLRFSDLLTINLRFFINFDARKNVTNRWPILKGSRIALRINNVTGSAVRVRDNGGLTPLRYQPGYLDPLGRTVEISFRKLF
jgi:hypothetical protein